MAGVAATATVYTLLALPGLVLALVLAAWRYDVTLHVSPMIVPAILLTAVAASCTGAALGHAIPNPVITTLVTNLLVFFVLLYSPIVFPAEQYPHWLVVINDVLPFSNMATIIRGALSDGLVHDVGRAYAIVGAWTIVSVVVSHHVVSRRG